MCAARATVLREKLAKGKRSRVERDKSILSTFRLRRDNHCHFGVHPQRTSPVGEDDKEDS
jgi:hypothetical protein